MKTAGAIKKIAQKQNTHLTKLVERKVGVQNNNKENYNSRRRSNSKTILEIGELNTKFNDYLLSCESR